VSYRNVEDVERRQLGESAEDLLVGAREVGEYLGRTPNVAYRLLTAGAIPCGRVGRLYVASKRTLDRHFADLTSGRKA
jgi:hypothetical protein